MLRNHLLVALRTLRRRQGYAALHVFGLALGLASCFLVLLYVQDELSYDRFHDRADRIFRLGEERMMNGKAVQMRSTGVQAADALRRDVPSVEAVVQTKDGAGIVRRPGAQEAFEEEDILFVSEDFFAVFSFPLLRGDPSTALTAPGSVVIAQAAATRLFGAENPVGQPLLLERRGVGIQDPEPIALTVRGVAADPPSASTIRFSLVISGSTEVQGYGGRAPALSVAATTYVLTRTPEDSALLEEVLPGLNADHDVGFGTFSKSLVEPLLSLHLSGRSSGGFAGNTRYLYLFGAIALVILLIACINYTNLSTAYAAQRAREVGVRKTLGARSAEVARQFLAETLLLAAAAGGLALGLVAMALPGFNHLFDKTLSLDPGGDPVLFLAMGAIVAGVGVLAGVYPALYLSRFRPAAVLKGEVSRGRGGARLRQGLVVVQFAATVALLASTAVIYEQLRFSQTRDLGFDGAQVLTLDLSAPALAQQRDAIQEAMEMLPGVRRTALTSAVPGAFRMLTMVSPTGTPDDPTDDVPVFLADTDSAFAATYGLELAAGRFFGGGASGGIVLNETAARRLGLMVDDPAAAVGRHVVLGGEQEVIGVLRDFHFTSLHREIDPVAMQLLGPTYNNLLLSLKLDGRDLVGSLASVRQVWERHAPYHPFAYRFVDDQFDALYRSERRLGQIFGAVAGIAVLLACLGLVGLAAFAAERRTREIGVRKVLGASVTHVAALLSGEFVRIVLVAFALGAPVAYVLMGRWLEEFAYRVELGPLPFALAGALALVLTLLAVGYHTIRAATADPVTALRSE